MIITLLRYWYVWIVALLTTGMFVLLTIAPRSIGTAIVAVGCICLIGLVYWILYRNNDHKVTILTALGLSIIGFIGLFVLIDDAIIRGIVAAVSVCSLSALMYIPQHFRVMLAHEYKPWRRMFVSIVTLALYACMTTLYGLDMFFQAPGIGWYGLIAGFISGFVAYTIFRMYYVEHTTRMLVWACVIGWLSIQVYVALSTLTFGYLVLGSIYVLVWYTGVVLIRFHLSAKGIVWNQQRTYVAGTCFLLIILFMFAKWL